MAIAKKDIPALARKCYYLAQKANKQNRDAETERLKFYVGGDLQWREEELTKRRGSQRPWVTINKCKPAVDQIEGDIRLNPPGPQCHPVGEGADGDTADILEGLIREVEYRSDAKTAYSTAGKYSAASGYAVLELATEFENERSYAQRLVINSIEDPATVFFDPKARMANRQDAMWAGKVRMYGKEEYQARFGSKRKILEPRGVQNAMGWIADAIGINGNMAELGEWTGSGQGPYYVCEFCMVEIEPVTLKLYTDGVARFDDEKVPPGVFPRGSKDYERKVGRRKVKLYTVDAMEILDETDWPGNLVRWIPVLGPEVYIEGKLHRLSLISGALDSQRALNYVATTSVELAGMMPKSPWVGYKGQFDDPRWQTANSEMWAYLEITPQFATDEMGQQQLLPPPQRNMWETPIQWLLALSAYFSDSIKAVTAIYDPSLGAVKGDQSGKAIEQLRSESAVGNFSYADNLHRAIGVMYREMAVVFKTIMDGPRVVTIVKPDSQHELVEINKEFGQGEDTKGKKRNSIQHGEYSIRVMAGKDFPTRQAEAVDQLQNFFKVAPQALAQPGVAAKFLRMIGEGNPQVEGMADLLAPDADKEATPQQLQGALAQSQQQNKVLTMLVEKLQQAMQSKLPELEFQKWKAAIDNVTRIRVAEINASKDMDKAAADREADMLDSMMSMAHESATQATDQQHEAGMQQADQQHQAGMQGADQQHQAQMQANEPEPAGATQE